MNLGAGGIDGALACAASHGRATPEHLAEAIVGLRRERPSWGPRKIIAKLTARQPEADWPAASTAGEILKRAGLVCARRLRRRARRGLAS